MRRLTDSLATILVAIAMLPALLIVALLVAMTIGVVMVWLIFTVFFLLWPAGSETMFYDFMTELRPSGYWQHVAYSWLLMVIAGSKFTSNKG